VPELRADLLFKNWVKFTEENIYNYNRKNKFTHSDLFVKLSGMVVDSVIPDNHIGKALIIPQMDKGCIRLGSNYITLFKENHKKFLKNEKCNRSGAILADSGFEVVLLGERHSLFSKELNLVASLDLTTAYTHYSYRI